MVEKMPMSDQNESVCFTCGHTTGGTLRLNCLPSGQVCPTCRDRLLDSLPPIFPSGEILPSGEIQEGATLKEQGETDENDLAQGPQLARKGPGQLLHGNGPNEPA
jgi:hypothetical protein